MARARVELWLERARMLYEEEDWDWFASLRVALRGLRAREAAWQPGGMNTIWQIVRHLTYWKEVGARRLEGEVVHGWDVDDDATFGPPGDPTDDDAWAATLARLEDAHRRLVRALSALSDDELDRPIPDEPRTLGETLAGLIEHDAYHAGQIVALRRLQGSWPPPQA